MKKHLIGFTIFSFIVISAIFIKFYFYVPESFDVPAPAVNSSCWKMKSGVVFKTYPKKIENSSPISYKIQDWTYDSETNVLNAKVRLDWNGTGNPPPAVVVQLNFFTLELPIYDVAVASEQIKFPFANGKSVTRTISRVVDNQQLIRPEKNYFGSVNIWSMDESGDNENIKGKMTIYSPTGDEKLAQSVPVLMIHEK